jgi:hypothetical protein
VVAWLTGLRSAPARRAYAADAVAWLAERDTSVLAAGRVHGDLWAAIQIDGGATASSARRRLFVQSSLYRYCATGDPVGRVPTHSVARLAVDPDYIATAA